MSDGVPGGYGAVGRRGGGGRVIEPIVPPTYGVSGGYYTDPQGRQITREQAQASGTVDRPGEAAEKLRSIGGGATTTQIEQRFGIEEALKRGEITRHEAIELSRRNLEGRPLEITRTVEQRKDIRDTQAAEAYFRGLAAKRTGITQQEAQRRQAIPERVYVTIAGKRVPFVSSAKSAQQRPAARIERYISEKNIEVSDIIKTKTPEPIRNFADAIDRRAQLSFRGEKPLNPFAFRNVAEAIYGIEKGAVKGVVEEPLTAGASLLVGGALAKGAGVLASRVPILTRGVGPGKVTSKISALNVASGVMAGYYGADVASRVRAADNRAQTIGKILSTEILPMAAGARFSQVNFVSTARNALKTQRNVMKEFAKSDVATSYFGGEKRKFTPKIESKFANKMDIEVRQASIRTANFRKYMEAPVSRARKQAPRQELQTRQEKPSSSYRSINLKRSHLENTSTMSELLRAPPGAKVTSGQKYKQESGRAKTLFEYGYGKRRGAVERQQYTVSQIDTEYMTHKQIADRIKIEATTQPINSIALQKQVVNVSQLNKSILKSIQKQETKQVSKQVPIAISVALSAQKAAQKEVAIQKTKQVSQQKYVSVAVSVQKQKTKQAQIVKNIFAQAQVPETIQKTKLKTPQVPDIKVPIKIKTPETPIKIKVPIKRPPTRIIEEPPIRPPRIKPPRRPPRRKIPPQPPTDFLNAVEDAAKASKKRGKFVWNIKNKIPTLESLIG